MAESSAASMTESMADEIWWRAEWRTALRTESMAEGR
jgi:hypothetical protein